MKIMTKRRVQFIFPNQTIEELDLLKDRMGASSRTEVLKTAIELMHWAMARLARGEKIAAVKDDGIAETIVIPGVRSARLSNGGSTDDHPD